MKFKLLAICVAILCLFCACSDDDSATNVKTSDSVKITSVTPNNCYNYQVVTIVGAGFGALKFNGYVDFGGVKQSDDKAFVNWSDNSISVIVPANAKSGTLKVVTKDNYASNSVEYTIKIPSTKVPVIKALSEYQLTKGSVLTISGANFGDDREDAIVDFNGILPTVYSSWCDTNICVIVPEGWNSGNLFVAAKGQKSNEIAVTNLSEINIPQITSLSSTTFRNGEIITIQGNNFGFNISKGRVIFDNTDASEISSWTNTAITVKVPAGVKSGKIYVKVSNLLSSGVDYIILSGNGPVISSLDVNIAQAGQTVIIYGSGFGASKGNSYVTFGGVTATEYSEWSDTKITVKVPQGAVSGSVKVFVDSKSSNELNITIQKTNTLVDLIAIPAGSFKMGSTKADDMYEYPQHEVKISKSFYMSKYEITQAVYKKVMSNINPSHPFQSGDNKPVNQISWLDAINFCNKLSQMENLTPCYTITNGNTVSCDFSANGYRLPTEAEWEYAAKGGINSDLYGTLNIIAWNINNSQGFLQDVGSKQPNAFGLYDMIGNASEWVWDIFDADYYKVSPASDPKGPQSGTERVYRGGSMMDETNCSSIIRQSGSFSGNMNLDRGFRIARNK